MATNKDNSGSYRYERIKTRNNEDKRSDGSYRYERTKLRKLPEVGEHLNSSITEWLNKNEAFYNSYNDRIGKRGDDPLKWSYEADSADWLDSITSQKSGLEEEADGILGIINEYGKYLDKDYVKSDRKSVV